MQAGIEDVLPLTVIWVKEETFDVVVAVTDGVGSGQQTPGDATTNGNTFVRVYQYLASGVTPDDPPAQWGNGAFNTSFGDWSDEPGVAANAAQVLWVANGGTSLDGDGYRQNRGWQKYATLTEQYAVNVQDSDTYTLDLTQAGIRYVRSLLPTGWGAWQLIEDGTGGWVPVIGWTAGHSNNALSVNEFPITNVDATYFNEMRVWVRGFWWVR